MSGTSRVADVFTADGRLDPDPSPGQKLVRELAAKASCAHELCKWLCKERQLDRDPVLGRPAHLSRAEDAYVRWQYARGRVVQRDGPLSHPYAVKWVRPGGWTPDATLGTVLLGDHTGGITLHQLFHDGYIYASGDGRPPNATIFPDEALADCNGGSHRVFAHIAGGVRLSPALQGNWTIVRTTPDLELIELLQAHEQIDLDPASQLPAPLRSDDAAVMREQYLELGPRILAARDGRVSLDPDPDSATRRLPTPAVLAKHDDRFAALHSLDRQLKWAGFPKPLGSRLAARLRGQRS